MRRLAFGAAVIALGLVVAWTIRGLWWAAVGNAIVAALLLTAARRGAAR
jgi:hypothetical protein